MFFQGKQKTETKKDLLYSSHKHMDNKDRAIPKVIGPGPGPMPSIRQSVVVEPYRNGALSHEKEEQI